jgi:glucan phosphoethanolaminetransferase (alkaline phosphatase superfamily)
MEKIDKNTQVGESNIRPDLNKHMQDLVYHLNLRANWFITISSFILVLVISNISRFENNFYTRVGLTVVILCVSLTLICMMLILVPYIKNPRKYAGDYGNDIFYFRNIQKNFTKVEFVNHLEKLRNNPKELDKVYGESIYNNASIRLPSITAKLKVGGWSLIIGLILGSILILFGFLY